MLGGFAAAALTGQQAAAQKRPNMVVILADDCSWHDIGCYGAVNNRTPHIDSLARAGMRFTNAWNSVSTSVPTRHCLYTGMYPIRNGGHYNLSAIREGVETMPVRLARLGYRVGLAGKWHIHPKEAFPFERVPGFAVNCLTKDPSHTMKGVEEFISRDREEPFCLVVASVNPHVPWTGGDPSKFDLGKLVLPPHFVDTPQTRKSYAAYLAEIDLLDREVGDVVRVLRERELLDDTLVIFLSEQGTQLTGAKWTNWNAGVHAAMIARWDGRIRPGRTTDAIVQYEDILPTLVALAGGSPDREMDGRSIAPLLEGRSDRHRKYAFHLHDNYPSGPPYPIRAAGDGRYRLIWNLTPDQKMIAKNMENELWLKSWKATDTEHAKFIVGRWYHRPEFELYDTAADPWELTNLAGKKEYARIQARLFRALKKWMRGQGDTGIGADTEQNKPANRPAQKTVRP